MGKPHWRWNSDPSEIKGFDTDLCADHSWHLLHLKCVFVIEMYATIKGTFSVRMDVLDWKAWPNYVCGSPFIVHTLKCKQP